VWAGIVEFYPVLSYSLCFFALTTIVGEVNRGLRVQRATAPSGIGGGLVAMFKRNHIRYGAHLIHFGVIVMTIAITASMAHKTEKEFTIGRGESFQVGRFSITLEGLSDSREKNYEAIKAVAGVTAIKDGARVATLYPELRFYPKNQTTTTEIALNMGHREDVYLVLAGLDATGTKASMKIFINPLQVWLWYGAIIMVFGGFLVAAPQLGARAVRRDIL
jgi:cytochrome c-type biogenesis protein CcmF